MKQKWWLELDLLTMIWVILFIDTAGKTIIFTLLLLYSLFRLDMPTFHASLLFGGISFLLAWVCYDRILKGIAK